jgi:AraC-like DNA-binding protein
MTNYHDWDFVYVILYCQNLIEKKTIIMKPLYNDFLTIARDIVEANCDDESFGCPALCEALKMSRSHVHRKLIEETSLSCSEFIQKARLKKAMELLINTNHPIYEVAFKVGYSDANYFSRSFSKVYGFPPSHCRQISA